MSRVLFLLLLASALLSCGSSRARSSAPAPRDGSEPGLKVLTEPTFIFVSDRCYRRDEDFDTIQAKLFLKNALLYTLPINAEYERDDTACLARITVSIPEFSSLKADTVYTLKVGILRGREVVKFFLQPFRVQHQGASGGNGGGDTSRPTDLWPGEGDQPTADRCVVKGREDSCQSFVTAIVARTLNENPPRLFAQHITQGTDLGQVVLQPDASGDGSWGTFTTRTSVLNAAAPRWAEFYGLAQGRYRVKYGRFSLLSADGSRAAYFSVTEVNDAVVLIGTVRRDANKFDFLLL